MRPLVLVLALFWGTAVNQKNKEGAELYKEGKLEDALQAFTEAQVESPDAPEIHYNIGNVHFRKGDAEKALAEYRAALRGSAEVVKRAQYATGNVRYRHEEFDGAVEAYKAALKVDPNDLEARQNLELSLRKKDDVEKKKDKEGGSDKNPSDEKKPSQKDRQQGKGPSPDSEPRQEQQQRQQASPQGMSREEAERLLAALAQMERAEQRHQQQRLRIRVPPRAKDW